MQLVVGLGNPGRRYASTRHNVGFLVVDRLASRWAGSCDRKQLGALVDKVRIGSSDVVLAKPQTFMNLSGQAVASLRGFYKPASVDDILVVHDELDLEFGTVRLKRGGGHGGHNGLRDIQARLGTNDFVRVRVGIGRPPEGWDTADYVLADPIVAVDDMDGSSSSFKKESSQSLLAMSQEMLGVIFILDAKGGLQKRFLEICPGFEV